MDTLKQLVRFVCLFNMCWVSAGSRRPVVIAHRLSSRGTWAPEQAGSVVVVGFSCSEACGVLVPTTRDQTRVPCITRWILQPLDRQGNHQTGFGAAFSATSWRSSMVSGKLLYSQSPSVKWDQGTNPGVGVRIEEIMDEGFSSHACHIIGNSNKYWSSSWCPPLVALV